MFQTGLHRWLQAPLVTGRLALLCGIAAVAVPTIVRAAIDGVVTGCEFTPYLPFVLITALALGWWIDRSNLSAQVRLERGDTVCAAHFSGTAPNPLNP